MHFPIIFLYVELNATQRLLHRAFGYWHDFEHRLAANHKTQNEKEKQCDDETWDSSGLSPTDVRC
jgi:hypothetical protein